MNSLNQDTPTTSTSSSNSNPIPTMEFPIRKITQEIFEFEGWLITVYKSPILPSQCYCTQGTLTIPKHNSLTNVTQNQPIQGIRSPPGTLCQVCKFNQNLTLHHLPEMVFPDNILRLHYQQYNFTLEFNAFDAMKLINTTSSPNILVHSSDEWKTMNAKSGLPLGESITPYDWTYSTDYKGTIIQNLNELPESSIRVDSNYKLNLDKLKVQEKILFYEEIPLYEDELHDNGISNLSVKIRVMPSGFFILLRFFLRVDRVILRMSDTRIHFEIGNNYFIRQIQIREEKYENLSHLQPQLFTDPNSIYSNLPIIQEINQRISLSN